MESKEFNVLSLFDGISCARVALERSGIKVKNYYRSEIDKYANLVSKVNYWDSLELGDVSNIDWTKLSNIDLLIGGSPCQDLSIAGKRKGLEGERSSLFYKYLEALQVIKPKYFILENVASMKASDKDLISSLVGVEPIMINAALVSAQQRKRLFWIGKYNQESNTYLQVEIEQPKDREIYLTDILETETETERLKSYCIDASYYKGANLEQYLTKKRRQLVFQKSKTVRSSGRGRGLGDKHNWDEYLIHNFALTEARTEEAKRIRKECRDKTGKDYSPRRAKELIPRADGKSNCLTTGITKEHLLVNDFIVRKLTPIECERLQGLPDNYTDGISNSQRYKCLGNAFNVDVIAHILSFIK